MIDRRAFVKRGLLWAAAVPTMAETLDRLAWQERRIFALGALPRPPRNVLELWSGTPGSPYPLHLLLTMPLADGVARGLVAQTGTVRSVVYKGETGLGELVDSVAAKHGLVFSAPSLTGQHLVQGQMLEIAWGMRC